MNIQLHPRSLAFGLVLLAAAFGFCGSFAYAQAIEPSTAATAIEADGNANLAMWSDTVFCIAYNGGDETCISEAALLASEPRDPNPADEVVSAVLDFAPPATESDAPIPGWAPAVEVAITETVIIAAPGQDAEDSDREPESTGSLPSDAASDLNDTPDIAAPAPAGTE